MSDLAAADSAVDGVLEDSFESLFAEYRERVYALCYRMCGRHSDAEDAVQETFVAVHRSLSGFRGDAAIGTWIYRIAIRAALRVRATGKRTGAQLPADLPTSDRDALEHRDEAQRVMRSVEELPWEQRVVLNLFAVEDLSHKQIAEILGVPRALCGRAFTMRARGWRSCCRKTRCVDEPAARRCVPSSRSGSRRGRVCGSGESQRWDRPP